MIECKPSIKKLTLTVTLLIATFFIKVSAQDGKALFQSKCASCHSLFKDATGPALKGFETRGPWADRQQLYNWVHNPAAFASSSPYVAGLIAQYKSMMQGFPTLTEAEIDAIADYIINAPDPSQTAPGGGVTVPVETGSSQNAVIFGVISLILAIIALILMQVNSNLKKLSDDAEGIQRPDPVPFYRNKVYIAMVSIVFFVIGGYFLAVAAVGLGRQKDYQPVQPIFYSHKVHAGINQINCLYCHGNAMESKHAAIPSTNVCMNCHKSITTYGENSPKLYDGDGNEVDGTAEIAKLHAYAGFDPANAAVWDPSKAKEIPWTKIHNLPDHVYFNHSQHVNAGNVQCQSCHGDITQMDEVFQFSDLSMGWCVNCHRESKVDFNAGKDGSGNNFYSIYEKFHRDMTPDTIRDSRGNIKEIRPAKMDSVTVEHIGGTECQKCHY